MKKWIKAQVVKIKNQVVEIKKQVLDEDNPLPWHTRIKIYAITIGIAFFSIAVGLFAVNFFSLGCLPLAQQVTLGLAVFGFIISIGHLIVKTHDVKKQFKDSYTQRAQQQLTTALGLLYGNKEDLKTRLAAMRLLSQLAQDENYVERDVIKKSFLLRTNLRNKDLSDLDLSGFYLQEADLREAKLRGANLSGADLREAKLSGVNLPGANLSGANLSGVNLKETADLSGADLRGADLSGVKNLDKAILADAKYNDETKFPKGFKPEDEKHGMKSVDN